MTTTASGSQIVGREDELAAIDAVLARAAGAPTTLVLEGEPGIGKSTLWRESVSRRSSPAFVVLAAEGVAAEAKLPFAVAADLLRHVTDEIGALPAPQRRALRVALFLEDADRPLAARAVSMAMLGLLRCLAEERPVLVAVDDLQWLDPSSREALVFALRRVEDSPISLLATARPGSRAELPNAEIVSVTALSVAAVGELLRARLDLRLPRPTLTRLHRASGGNPFYVLEFGRALARADAGAEEFPVPDDLGSLLRRRVHALTAAGEEAVLVAALLARPTRDLVERLTSAEGLRAAVAAGIVERRGDVVSFMHPLLASVAVGGAGADEVRALHRRIAEAQPDDRERAWHLALAAAGPDEAVAASLEREAIATRGRGAVFAAAELSQRALTLTPHERPHDRVRRGLLAAEHVFVAGDARGAAATLEEVLAGADRGDERARVLLHLGQARGEADDVGTALELFGEALAEPGLSPALEAQLLLFRGEYAILLVRWADAHEAAAAAVPVARACGDLGTLAHALALRGLCAFSLGRGLDEEAFREAVELERAGAEVWWDWSPRVYLATVLNWSNRRKEGIPLLEQVIEEVRAAADPSLASVLVSLANEFVHEGELDRAEACLREALREAERDGREVVAAVVPAVLATIASIRGDAELARQLAAEGIERAEATVQTRHVHTIRAALGELELSLGRADAALAAVGPSLPEWQHECGSTSLFRPVATAALALAALGRPDEARAAAGAWIAAVRATPTADAECAADWAEAAIAAAGGDDAAAVTAYEAAVASARTAHLPFPLARILLSQGMFLRHRRQLRDARRVLEEAVALLDGLGARLWAANARAELARLGGRRTATGKLTPTEQQVADLVASGRSNQEVARELFLSPKTVEWNLSKIYRKLGIHSRGELAAKQNLR